MKEKMFLKLSPGSVGPFCRPWTSPRGRASIENDFETLFRRYCPFGGIEFVCKSKIFSDESNVCREVICSTDM
jgi:hypothetical protein